MQPGQGELGHRGRRARTWDIWSGWGGASGMDVPCEGHRAGMIDTEPATVMGAGFWSSGPRRGRRERPSSPHRRAIEIPAKINLLR
jgi:hypothetical protein